LRYTGSGKEALPMRSMEQRQRAERA